MILRFPFHLGKLLELGNAFLVPRERPFSPLVASAQAGIHLSSSSWLPFPELAPGPVASRGKTKENS